MTQSTIRIGMVGLDTSHCPAFTAILNRDDNPYHVTGARVVGAYPGGSAGFALSRDRVQGFTDTLKNEYGIPMYDSIESLVRDVDAILLESVDGRQHLDQFRQMAVGKPVFIDKPLTTSTAEARELIRLAAETNTPILSASSLRYSAGIEDLVYCGTEDEWTKPPSPSGSAGPESQAGPEEKVFSCEAFGPAAILDDFPGLFWYGIHSAEILFSFMGKGCTAVRCVSRPDMDVVVGEWGDGRTGVIRGTRFEKSAFGCVVHTSVGAKCGLAQSTPPGYYCLIKRVVAFMQTGVSPIDIEETFGTIAFLEAADKSKAQSGACVRTEAL